MCLLYRVIVLYREFSMDIEKNLKNGYCERIY